MRIAGIRRAPENSPNMSDKDNMLLEQVAKKLQARGHSVEILDAAPTEKHDALFHMSRTPATLEQLARHEKDGAYVTNSVRGVLNCSRENFTNILEQEGIKQAPYRLITPTTAVETLQYPGWLKNAEGWSCTADDVQYIANASKLTDALKRLLAKGTEKALYCEHIQGDIVKFYGIDEDSFFRLYYPNPDATKFGLEKLNGTPQKYAFSQEKLREKAFAAAQAIGVEIFGGDCIVTATGEIFIIDFNDFPSFSVCRDEAAESIAALIERKAQR